MCFIAVSEILSPLFGTVYLFAVTESNISDSDISDSDISDSNISDSNISNSHRPLPFPSSYSCASVCFRNIGSASQGSAGSLPSRGSNASRSHLLSAATLETSVGGGLSVTACLNDFSLYIFHPYGGGQKKASLSVLENTFRKGVRSMAGN